MEEKKPERKPTRVKNYDYSSVGAYFITICTKNRAEILCNIVGDGALDVPKVVGDGALDVPKVVEDVAPYKTTFVCIEIRFYIQKVL